MNVKALISAKESALLVSDALGRAMSYTDYLQLFEEHVNNNTSTYPLESESMANYTRLNWSRSKRVAKTLSIPEEIMAIFSNYKQDHSWLVITESWCGDAAQSVPVMQGLLELAREVPLKVVLRDEFPELMDAFLFDGTRSIPILIIYDHKTNQVVGSWGPRPDIINEQVRRVKLEEGGLTEEFKKQLQQWYNKDKGQTTMADLAALVA